MEFDGCLQICQKLQPSFVKIDLISFNNLLSGKTSDSKVVVSVKRLNCLDGHDLVICIADDADVGCAWVGNVTWLIVHIILLDKIMQFLEVVEVRLEL